MRKDAMAIKDTIAQYDMQQKQKLLSATRPLLSRQSSLTERVIDANHRLRKARNAEVEAACLTNSATAKYLRTERCAITAVGLATWPGCAFPPYKESLKQREAVGLSEQSRTRIQNRRIYG